MKFDLDQLGHYFSWDEIYQWAIDILIAGIILFILIMALGCASVKVYRQPMPVKSFSIAKSPEQDDLEQKFQEVLDYCIPRLNAYEDRSITQARKSYWMNVSGMLSGSVMVPMLIASGWGSPIALLLQAGFAGYAGSVPFMSQSLQQSGLSGMAAATTRNVMVERISRATMTILDAGQSYDERRSAIMGVAAECTIYPIFVPTSMYQEAMK